MNILFFKRLFLIKIVKTCIAILLLVSATGCTSAQSSNATIIITEPICGPSHTQLFTGKNPIYTSVDHSAEFPGGIDAYYSFLIKNLRYPKAAKDANIRGKVFTTFVVEKDGSLSNIKTLRGLGYGCDEEAVRVLKASPKWKPGEIGGKVVRQQYTLPIAFVENIESQTIRISEPVCDVSRQHLMTDKAYIYTAPENSAEFAGGNKKFHAYLGKTMRYPEPAKKANIQGKVFVTFVVEKNGNLSNFKILRGLGYGCDQEAVRVLKSSPKWKPGEISGKVIRQQYTVAIPFTRSKSQQI